MGLRRSREPSRTVCRAAIDSRASAFAASSSSHASSAYLLPAYAELGAARAVSDILWWVRIGARSIVATGTFDDSGRRIWRGVSEGFATGARATRNAIATTELFAAGIDLAAASRSVTASELRVAASTSGVTTGELRVAACPHAIADATAGVPATGVSCIAATGVLRIATAAFSVVATARGVRVTAPC